MNGPKTQVYVNYDKKNSTISSSWNIFETDQIAYNFTDRTMVQV